MAVHDSDNCQMVKLAEKRVVTIYVEVKNWMKTTWKVRNFLRLEMRGIIKEDFREAMETGKNWAKPVLEK